MTVKTFLLLMGIIFIGSLIGLVYFWHRYTILEDRFLERGQQISSPRTETETPINIEGKNIPSICDAHNWSIAYIDGMYYERLPSGSIWSLEAYYTREKCQQAIDKDAAEYMAKFKKFGNL